MLKGHLHSCDTLCRHLMLINTVNQPDNMTALSHIDNVVKRTCRGSQRASGRAQGKAEVTVKVVNVAVECCVFDRLLLMLLLLLGFSPHRSHLQGFY